MNGGGRFRSISFSRCDSWARCNDCISPHPLTLGSFGYSKVDQLWRPPEESAEGISMAANDNNILYFDCEPVSIARVRHDGLRPSLGADRRREQDWVDELLAEFTPAEIQMLRQELEERESREWLKLILH